MPPANSLITPRFKKYARLLNDLPVCDTASPFYEMMSGALMWPDQKANIPFAKPGWSRAALAYRSSLILNSPKN
jgi:hypothetical protein